MKRLLVAMALAAAGCGDGSTAPTAPINKAKVTTPPGGDLRTPPKPAPPPK